MIHNPSPIEVDVEIEDFGVVAEGTLAELCIGYDKNFNFEDGLTTIDLDESKSTNYSYKKEKDKLILEISAAAKDGDIVKLALEGQYKNQANKFYSVFISQKILEIYSYRFKEGKNEK